MKFVITGKPIPLPRAKQGKYGFYDPSYQAKKNFAWEVKQQYNGLPLSKNKGISVAFQFFMEMPKTWSNKKKERFNMTLHEKRPDFSNLQKFVEDSLNGILWEDDSIIANLDGSFKKWSYESKTIIDIKDGI
jgi:Holliday junction resolvase RusA-like endonuclease